MNHIIIISMILSMILLSGCAVNKQQAQFKQQVISASSSKHAKSISNNRISVGMTNKQVVAAWGQPGRLCSGTGQTSRGYSWQYCNIFASAYRGSTVYFDNSDKVIYWRR